MKAIKLDRTSLNNILMGSALLGSGGGGSISSGKHFLEIIGDRHVELISFPLSTKQKELVGCIVCDIGSITAFDNLQDEALSFAFEQLTNHFGRINAFLPIETGPENMLAPFVLAAKYNLPVIDADGAGRAVPTLPLCTFSVKGIRNWSPMAISNGKGDTMLVSSQKKEAFENILREIAGTKIFSSSASLAMWPEKLNTLSGKSIQGAITNALNCGCLLEGIRTNNRKLIDKYLRFVNALTGYLIGVGKVVYKTTREEGAFNITITKIQDRISNSIITIHSQNESLIAFNEKHSDPVAIAPDSICYLDKNFNALTNAEILVTGPGNENSQEVFLIGITAHAELKEPKMHHGFKQILEGLGYAGSMSIPTIQTVPLGQLLIEIDKNYNK